MNSASLPTISIVTPSFNQAEFLRDNLESVAAQEGVDVEHIVMDGGSTDGSAEIIREFAGGLAHWQSEKDEGQTDALIRGFAFAKGEVFGWLNSDDYLWDRVLSCILSIKVPCSGIPSGSGSSPAACLDRRLTGCRAPRLIEHRGYRSRNRGPLLAGNGVDWKTYPLLTN